VPEIVTTLSGRHYVAAAVQTTPDERAARVREDGEAVWNAYADATGIEGARVPADRLSAAERAWRDYAASLGMGR
jgi:hypothetical protein